MGRNCEIKYKNITSHHKKKLHRSILASISLLELSIWCNMSNLSSGQLMWRPFDEKAISWNWVQGWDPNFEIHIFHFWNLYFHIFHFWNLYFHILHFQYSPFPLPQILMMRFIFENVCVINECMFVFFYWCLNNLCCVFPELI